MDDPNIIKYVLDFGAIGVMAVGLWAFLTGALVSRKTHDSELATQERASEMAVKIISQDICEKIESGVAVGIERGIVKGYLKINGGEIKR